MYKDIFLDVTKLDYIINPDFNKNDILKINNDWSFVFNKSQEPKVYIDDLHKEQDVLILEVGFWYKGEPFGTMTLDGWTQLVNDKLVDNLEISVKDVLERYRN